MRRTALLLSLVFSLSTLAHAASFNCSKATTARERTICSTPALSTLDDQLAAAYTSARDQLSTASADLIRSDQRDWLHQLDALCPPAAARYAFASNVTECLTHEYTERLDQLTKGISHHGGMTFFSRYYLGVVPAAPGDDSAPNDPGFGVGSFAWPQIDNPTPSEASWNEAVYHRLLRLAASEKATSLDAAVDSSGTVNSYFNVIAANQSLIEVDLTLSSYGWGAAHPLTNISSFAFWLNKNRPLTLADLFRDDSHWKTGLVNVVIAKLKAGSGDAGIFWKDAELRKAVAAGIADPASWDISKDNITIRFGQYAVASYAEGMPEATFRWRDLHAFLNPTLDPAKLPPPIQPAH